MSIIQMILPKMGESIHEAKVLKWLKPIGSKIEMDESVLEVATDKIDTEVPSIHKGFLKEILIPEGAMAQVGQVIAILESEVIHNQPILEVKPVLQTSSIKDESKEVVSKSNSEINTFYSPLVMNIAKEENISISELSQIVGTGKENRVTKIDLIQYIADKKSKNESSKYILEPKLETNLIKENGHSNVLDIPLKPETTEPKAKSYSYSGNSDIIEMDRMRKMIAERMIDSRKISAHVTSFVEADVSNIVIWRNKMKHFYFEKENTSLTLTPIFIEALAKALKEYPIINSSIENDKIIVKKDINIGLAVALTNGNLIVPVIKNADQYNLVGLTKKINDLAKRARTNELTPDELSGGTYTMSNMGSFGNVMGTPIIVQPQVAIMAFGVVTKKPAVIETPQGDTLGIRNLMFLSHSYDHRIIDGALGGIFVRKVADYLEQFDVERKL